MKKIIGLLLLAFTMLESANGQISLNFSGGMNYSNWKFRNAGDISSEPRSDYFFGIAPSYELNSKLRFLIDFQYSRKGLGNINNLNQDFRFSYIDILPEIECKLLPYLILGMGMNYAFKVNEEFKISGEDWEKTADFVEFVNLFDLGITGKIKTEYKNIFAFARYNLGLIDISNLEYADINGEISDSDLFNRNLQIGIGYRLDFINKK